MTLAVIGVHDVLDDVKCCLEAIWYDHDITPRFDVAIWLSRWSRECEMRRPRHIRGSSIETQLRSFDS